MNWHGINWGNVAVNVMIGLDIVACIGYGFAGDWKRAFYWFASTLIMIAVRIM
jgi:hypothetical protein